MGAPPTPYPKRLVQLDVARARYGDRIDRLAPFLFYVDDAADAVVREIDEHPPSWSDLETALHRGAEAVPHAAQAISALVEHSEHVPAWVDWPTIERAGRVLVRSGPIGGLVLGVRSLVAGYASPGGNKPLAFSGRLRQQAARRLNETARFVQAVTAPRGLLRGRDGYVISVKVRIMHARVRQMILAAERDGKKRWDTTIWGAPLNQHDMLGTLLLFSVVMLDGLRMMGMEITHEEGADYMHLWRYVAHLLGIDPELVPMTESEARLLTDLFFITQGKPDDDSRALTEALLDSGDIGRTDPNEPVGLLGRHRRELGRAFCRELVGDEIADGLRIPRTRWRHAVPVFQRTVRAFEAARRLPGGEARAIARGTRYWAYIVSPSLRTTGAEFRPPEELSGVSHHEI